MIFKILSILFVIILFSNCSTLRFSRKKDRTEKDELIAKINNEKLDVKTFNDILKDLPQEYKKEEKIKRRILNNYINYRLIVQDALKRKIHQTSDYQEKLDMLKDELLIHEVQQRIIEESRTISTPELYRFYLQNINSFTRARLYHLKIIETETQTDIDTVVQLIKDGGDFEEIAKEYSVHHSQRKGGDLGFVDIEEMPDILEKSILLIEPGQISPVIYYNNKYHIFKLKNVRPERVLGFDEIKDELRNDYMILNARRFWQLYIENLVRDANIKINDDVLKNLY